jgi:hypothetical protein
MEPFAIPPLVNIAHFRKVNNSERAPDGGLSPRPGDAMRISSFGRPVEPPTARRSGRRRHHFDALVIADGFNVHATLLGEFTD